MAFFSKLYTVSDGLPPTSSHFLIDGALRFVAFVRGSYQPSLCKQQQTDRSDSALCRPPCARRGHPQDAISTKHTADLAWAPRRTRAACTVRLIRPDNSAAKQVKRHNNDREPDLKLPAISWRSRVYGHQPEERALLSAKALEPKLQQPQDVSVMARIATIKTSQAQPMAATHSALHNVLFRPEPGAVAYHDSVLNCHAVLSRWPESHHLQTTHQTS